MRPLLQNNHSKMDWRCGSNGRVPVLQAQNSAFKPQYHQKKKKDDPDLPLLFHVLPLPIVCPSIRIHLDFAHCPECLLCAPTMPLTLPVVVFIDLVVNCFMSPLPNSMKIGAMLVLGLFSSLYIMDTQQC
jgi:hypothetical protein